MKRIFFLAAGAALSASLAATVLATSALAQSAREIRGPSPYLAIQNEPAPKHQGERTMTAASETPKARTVDMKFEIVVVPVSDVDRAKGFYGGLGWRLDADFAASDDFRVIQFTPPGSGCSVIFGKNVTVAAPGSAQGLYLIVSDIKAARDELLGRGVEISEVFHGAGDVYVGTDEPYLFGRVRVSGPDSEHRSYRSFASFKDPDGNGWLFQDVTARLPGRVDADDTTFTSSTELAAALRRAAAAHGEHEKRTGGQHDANWPDWYAEYIVREQAGKELPT
jgi:catechol 2,3-dioxygenase-like lactoylglutathione lyase family enzyme